MTPNETAQRRLTVPQRLALQAVRDGSVDYASPRTMKSLASRGLVVWLGDQSPYSTEREWGLTKSGEAALRAIEGGGR